MYVTAHRVVGTGRSRREAVHAFRHEHGRVEWPDDVGDWPETNPGTLVDQTTVLKVGGNTVRSYLDLLMSDRLPWVRAQEALEEFRRRLPELRNPAIFRHRKVTIRLGLELALEGRKIKEFDELRHAVEELAVRTRSRGGR